MSNKFFSYTAACILFVFASCSNAKDNTPILTSDDFFEPETGKIENTFSDNTEAEYYNNDSSNYSVKTTDKAESFYADNTLNHAPINTKVLANKLKKHIIAMVYPDTYQNSQIKILQENTNGAQLELLLSVTWKDQWVNKPYVVEGKLQVNEDGSNAHFVIMHKNTEAEALEITYENFKTEIRLAQI